MHLSVCNIWEPTTQVQRV